MPKSNSEYWKQRSIILEESKHKKAMDYYAELDKQYKIADQRIQAKIEVWYSRFANNNNISVLDAKKMLNSKELAEFKWDVKHYIEYGRENALDQRWIKELENASAKVHISRLESLRLQIQHQNEILYGNQLDGIDKLAKDVFTDSYYHTAYEIQKGLNVGWDLHTLDDKKLATIVNKPWTTDGKTFSDRIWTNKTKLVGTIQTELTQSIMRGEPLKKAIERVSKTMNVGKHQAARLVLTESAYFHSASQSECYKDLDVELYEIVATLDKRTSEICQDLDGGIYNMKDYQPGETAPPFHPYCRTVTAPTFLDEEGYRAARNDEGKTYLVPSDMTYKKWKESFVDGGSKEGLKPVIPTVIIPVKEFIPAKTTQEANDYATKELGIPYANYKGLDIEVANAWNKGLKDSFERFPKLKDNIKWVGEAYDRNEHLKATISDYYLKDFRKQNPNMSDERLKVYVDKYTRQFMGRMTIGSTNWAQSWSPTSDFLKKFTGVTFNKKTGNNASKLLESVKRTVETKFHPVGCDNIKSILDHEIGHQLDDLLGIGKIKEIQDLRNIKLSDLTDKISKYSWDNPNPDRYSEMIAEGWSEYLNNPNPREYARKIGETIENEYKKQFGGK